MVSPAARGRSKLACIVLAAGGSSRLGAPKQLARRRVRPLILNAIAAARDALGDAEIVVVLGAQALRIRALLRRHAPGARTALNPRWSSGLASSLRAGLRAAPRDAPAVLVILVDQPDVDAGALRRLVAAWRRHPAVPAAAAYAQRAGVPAIFPRRSWTALQALHGDEGARAVLRGAAALTLVPMPEAEFDVDTREDLERL
jgi:CTP:molybdopterin cytidylyltransferase MocA